MRLSMEEVEQIKYFIVHDSGLNQSDLNDLIDTIEAMQQWVNDLQSGMYVNCFYCGHRYGPEDEVPASMADVLKEHIENCPEHPMSKLKQENEQLRAQAAAIREALSQALFSIVSGGVCSIGYSPQISVEQIRRWTESIFSDAGKDYHNPADVEALEFAKDALINISEYWNGDSNVIAMMDACTNNRETALETLAAIEKAFGGKKDGI